MSLSDGNDKIEEKLKEKQKKKTNSPTEESSKPAEKPTKRKKVDLTFDYDPEKECKSVI